ncbi:hypothetical protein SteCoe_7095 [Stentor coeruleus]|uniref:Uncharacterized protein n=1 Tax=Stentor coeruleus TaxID=5963 RepID=A0A1R2CNB6_9CILI|nr:hypothetical protein SteCoe_7095 [Stentor coeruleus]
MECYLTYLKGHNADVNSLSTSGNIMASGSDDGTVRIWDLNTHKSVRRVTDEFFFPSKSVENVSLSGFSLFTSTESRLFLFDIRNPSKILVTQSISTHTFSDEISQISQINNIGCLSLDNGEIVIFNTNTLEIQSIYQCHNNICSSAQIISENYIISGGFDCRLKVTHFDGTEFSDLDFYDFFDNKSFNPPHIYTIASKGNEAAVGLGNGNICLFFFFTIKKVLTQFLL